MDKFEKVVYVPPKPAQIEEMIRIGKRNNFSRDQVLAQIQEMKEKDVVYKNSTYQVSVRDLGEIFHASIKRLDRNIIKGWREKQEIKNLIFGKESEAVELFPAESRLVDTANQYHLFVLKSYERFPFGFIRRMVDYKTDRTFTKQEGRDDIIKGFCPKQDEQGVCLYKCLTHCIEGNNIINHRK